MLSRNCFFPGQRSGELRRPSRRTGPGLRDELSPASILKPDLAAANLTPLHLAVLRGHAACVRALTTRSEVQQPLWSKVRGTGTTAEPAGWISLPDRWGFTPLDYARIFGLSEIAAALESVGAKGSIDTADIPTLHAGA